MQELINVENILFLDIETIPGYKAYKKLPGNLKKLWDKKASYLKQEEADTPETLYPRAGIYAEFGKVICISVAFIKNGECRIKSFYGDDEKVVLEAFCDLLNKHFYRNEHKLCAHNGKEFDFPFLARRILVNGIKMPYILELSGKKPWEVGHLDTMELWKFGDYKNYTSLELLATLFQIPSPKDDIEGSDIARVYWEEKNLQRIVTYCQKDVTTVMQVYLRINGAPLFDVNKITIVE